MTLTAAVNEPQTKAVTPASSARPNATTTVRRQRTAELLAELAACTDNNRRRVLRDEAVELNLDVVHAVVARYRNRGIDIDDLTQVASLGLVKAVDGFDPGAGHAFLSYAVPTIRGEVRRYFRDHGWAVRPPRPVQELQTRISSSVNALSQYLGRPPRPSEIAEHLEVELDDVIEAMSADGCFSPSSLDTPVEDNSNQTLGQTLASTDEGGRAAVDARMMLAPAIQHLSDRDRRILYLRFFEGRTQRQIGDDLGVTQMQVSRQLSRIMRTLRQHIGTAVGTD